MTNVRELGTNLRAARIHFLAVHIEGCEKGAAVMRKASLGDTLLGKAERFFKECLVGYPVTIRSVVAATMEDMSDPRKNAGLCRYAKCTEERSGDVFVCKVDDESEKSRRCR